MKLVSSLLSVTSIYFSNLRLRNASVTLCDRRRESNIWTQTELSGVSLFLLTTPTFQLFPVHKSSLIVNEEDVLHLIIPPPTHFLKTHGLEGAPDRPQMS